MSQKILIVEDDRKAADLIRLYLERDGYQVLAAHDGKLGLELTRRKQPDLIILDLMLPEIDGLDVCSRDPRRIIGSHHYAYGANDRG